ncbi:hypothetical protein B0H14DRAFT_2678534 [Mycena olivaceomarginata]|nr:hypothetical protein B0H14DRAFT_2678534 [Mycena olivaceomarginata]
MGSASVLGNSYQNDATSSATNERTFYRCPLPLTTTFIPLNPGLQFMARDPFNFESMGEKEGNAGVYQTAVAEGPKDVRGAVGYVLPGVNSSILVIYFDAVKCRLLFVDSGTVIDSNIVDKVEAEGKKKVSGSLVLEHGGGSNFVAEETPDIMPGNLVEMQVLLRNVMTAPVPPPPEKGEELMTHH